MKKDCSLVFLDSASTSHQTRVLSHKGRVDKLALEERFLLAGTLSYRGPIAGRWLGKEWGVEGSWKPHGLSGITRGKRDTRGQPLRAVVVEAWAGTGVAGGDSASCVSWA